MGLRETKKERTRGLIVDTAWRLFADHGFDTVAVSDIAREAEVSKATVFNYFPTKEDLFFPRLEDFGKQVAEAVASRAPGETALSAFSRHLESGLNDGLLGRAAAGDTEALSRLKTVNRLISESPALQVREREAAARCAGMLAAVLAAEAGTSAEDIAAQVAADAMLGVHRALVAYVRRRVLNEDHPGTLATDVREETARACALLEHGLGSLLPGQPASAGES